MSDNNYKPMKGAHLVLNEKVCTFLLDSISKIDEYMDDNQVDEDPTTILKALEKEGWTAESDSFGQKRYTSMVYPVGPAGQVGELRVTVVLTKRGGLNVDIRPWGNY
jgi:hypothetical protein